MITRRKALGQFGTFSLGTVVGMSGLASPSAALAQDKVKLRIGVVPVIDMAPFFAALKLGYFEAAFSNTVSILLAIQEGIEFRFITGGALNGPEPPDVLALYARKDSNIKS